MTDSEFSFICFFNLSIALTPSAFSYAHNSDGQFVLRPGFDKRYNKKHGYLIVFAVPVFNKFV
jgi:hypothetical protein